MQPREHFTVTMGERRWVIRPLPYHRAAEADGRTVCAWGVRRAPDLPRLLRFRRHGADRVLTPATLDRLEELGGIETLASAIRAHSRLSDAQIEALQIAFWTDAPRWQVPHDTIAQRTPAVARALGILREAGTTQPTYQLRPGLVVEGWPPLRRTSDADATYHLWKLFRRGYPVRTDAVTDWPAPLVEAFQLLDRELDLLGDKTERTKKRTA